MSDDYADLGDVMQACPNCGTLETDMDDPVRVTLESPDDVFDRHSVSPDHDATYEMVFCSDSCHEQWADRKD
jgi:hypothetical protein